MTKRKEFWRGVEDTLPLVIGAVPFGILFGALSISAGISPAGTLGLSLFVFAGSSQFIAANLVANGTGIAVIIFTTFIVNLRHALYSTTLGPHLSALPHRWLLPLGFWLTDETFVVTANRFNQADSAPNKHWYFLGSAVFMYVNWQLCTLVGVIAGQAIPNPLSWGLDFAMSVTFIGMVVPMAVNRPTRTAIAVAGALSILTIGFPNKLGLMVSAMSGVGAAVLVDALESARQEKSGE